jgi:uncharacterized membrane protein
MGAEDRFCGECGFDLDKPPSEKTETSLGLNENLEGALCYLLWWLTGLFFLIFEKKNKFVKFHAIQSILLSLPYIIMLVLFEGTDLMGLLSLIYFILWVFLMYKASVGEKYKLSGIGNFAEEHSKV